MSLPPQTTVVFENVPEGWLIGIDLHFFNATPQFRGIKLVPDGVHIVHWGMDQDSIRTGVIFVARNETTILARWNAETEEMELDGMGIGELDVSAIKSRIGQYYQYMVNYPVVDTNAADSQSWGRLTDCIPESMVDILPIPISSTSTTKQEMELLRQSIQQKDRERAGNRDRPDDEDKVVQSILDKNEDELKFTVLSKQTWEPGAAPSVITQKSRDKSWYLNELIKSSSFSRKILGEMQLSFILMLVLANYSAAQQWVCLVELVLSCDQAVEENPSWWFGDGNDWGVFQLVHQQLKICPVEYAEGFLEAQRLAKAFASFSWHHNVPVNVLSVLENNLGIEIPTEDSEDEDPVIVDDS